MGAVPSVEREEQASIQMQMEDAVRRCRSLLEENSPDSSDS